jgi:hypothetical protein
VFNYSSLYTNYSSFYSSYIVGVLLSEASSLFTSILFSVSTVNCFLIAGYEDLLLEALLFFDFEIVPTFPFKASFY